MSLRPRKRSVKISGHLTSVSVEEPFWVEFKRIAESKGLSINQLARDIDVARGGDSVALATAIRLYVLRWYQEKLEGLGDEMDDETGDKTSDKTGDKSLDDGGAGR